MYEEYLSEKDREKAKEWRDEKAKENEDIKKSFEHLYKKKIDFDDFNAFDFLTEKGAFLTSDFAEYLKEKLSFKTLIETEELLVFKNGIYESYGEQLVKKIMDELLSNRATIHRVNEVIFHIKASTYISLKEFNKNENIIVLRNGIYDLKENKFKEHFEEVLSTTKLNIFYRKEADCPKIKKFISEIVCKEDVSRLQEFIGYCFYKKYHIQKAFMLIGGGANGKSTFLELINRLIGTENISNVSLQQLCFDKFATAILFGKLVNIYADLSSKGIKETGMFKTLTGGDWVEAQKKFQNSFRFKNFAKLIFSANQLPEVHDDSDAFFRRWEIINFPNIFAGDNVNKNLIEEISIQEELSGLFNWAIGGLKRLLENEDFSETKATEDVREQYIRMSSSLQAFLKDLVIDDTEAWITKEEFYNRYSEYCRKFNIPSKNKLVVGRELPRFKHVLETHPKIDGRQVKAWKGIKFIDDVKKKEEQPIKETNLGSDFYE